MTASLELPYTQAPITLPKTTKFKKNIANLKIGENLDPAQSRFVDR